MPNLATQLDLFTPERLPVRPSCANDPDAPLLIRNQAHALRRRWMQLNSPAMRYWLAFDVPRDYVASSWEGRAAEPNFIVTDPESAEASLIYGIDVPVCTSDAGRLKPLRYAAAIDQAYTRILGGNRNYPGIIARNPSHRHWKVHHGPQTAYDLDGLAAFVSPRKLGQAKRTRKNPAGLHRDCSMFDLTRHWAYQAVHRCWISETAWREATEIQALAFNTYKVPLSTPEVQWIASSVASWCWERLRSWSQEEYIARTHSAEIQAARGKKSGVARRKGTLLEKDPQPWIKQGISKATWYRKNPGKNGGK